MLGRYDKIGDCDRRREPTEPCPSGLGPGRLTPAALCCYVHQADCRGRTVGTTTFAANHTTATHPSGHGPFQMAFSSAEPADTRKLPNKANLLYKPSYFNNLADSFEAKKRPLEAKTSQWLPARSDGRASQA